MGENKNGLVQLKSIGPKKQKTQKLGVDHAKKILSLSNSQWKLDDKAWKWNGKELSKA